MSIAEEIYQKCVWGKTPVITVLAQVADTEFKKGGLIVKCHYDKIQGCLCYQDIDPERENKVIFTYRLWQNGRKSY